jgi:hypothetical protein
MTITQDENALLTLAALLPCASRLRLEFLAYKNPFAARREFESALLETKEALGTDAAQADDLIIDILLNAQSLEAAKHKVAVYKSGRALGAAQEGRQGGFEAQNKDYIVKLYEDKKISFLQEQDLLDIYCAPNALNLQVLYEDILNKLNAANANGALNNFLAANAALWLITPDEAMQITALEQAVKYRLLPEDLQTIALKYLKLKTPQEINDTFETILKRLPHAYSAAENLGLAVRVMTEASEQALTESESRAAVKKQRALFLKTAAQNKFFAGYEDEITRLFFPRHTLKEAQALFEEILNRLPHRQSAAENEDLAIKVLLKKLPLKEAVAQAAFRKEDKRAADNAGALEEEALGRYLGTKTRGEALAFLRGRLNAFTFWREDESKYIHALSLIVGELNGSLSAFSADLALLLMQQGAGESVADIVINGLAGAQNLQAQDVARECGRFYAASKDWQDAARRTLNMFTD